MTNTHTTDSSEELREPWTVTPCRDGYNVHEGKQLVGWFADRALAQQIADENNAIMSRARSTTGAVEVHDQTTRPQMGDEEYRTMASEDFAEHLVAAASWCAGQQVQRPYSDAAYIALLREAASRVRASLPNLQTERDQIIPGTIEAFVARMKHVIDNYGSKLGLTDEKAAELAVLLTKDADWLMRAAHFFAPASTPAQSGLVEALKPLVDQAKYYTDKPEVYRCHPELTVKELRAIVALSHTPSQPAPTNEKGIGIK